MIKIILNDPMGGVLSVSNSLMAAMNKEGLECSIFNMSEMGGRYYLRILKAAKKFLNESRDSQLILQHFDAIFLGIFLRLFGYKKIINVVHIDLVGYYDSIGIFKKSIVSLMFFLIRNDCVVFVSKEAELRAIKKFNLRKTYTIYNIFDFPSVEARARVEREGSGVILGVVSRMHRVKNVNLAVQLVHELRQKNINVSLNIYGGGSNEEVSIINQLISRLKADGGIKYCGVVDDKKKIFNSIDGLISFSSIEGLPTVILESIGYGVPVFYTDCSSGPRELMSPESDVLQKTTTYQRTAVGYLVRPVVDSKSRETTQATYYSVYEKYLSDFVVDIVHSNFSMLFDESRFSSSEVIRQWRRLIFS